MHDALSVKIVSFPKLGEEEEEVHQTSVFYREIQMSTAASDHSFKSTTTLLACNFCGKIINFFASKEQNLFILRYTFLTFQHQLRHVF